MPAFLRPATLQEALAHLAQAPKLRILAGGTDVYPTLGDEVARVALMDITGIEALQGVTLSDSSLRIGALATWTEVQRMELPPAFAALQQAGREVGSPQVQNSGTVVGNICNASPAADGTVALLALDAEVEIAGPQGTREMPLADFVTGVRQVALQAGEFVTAVHIKRPDAAAKSAFLKLGARRYLVISIAMVAALIECDAQGKITGAAIAVGACSPVAQRLPALEKRLIGLGKADIAGALRPEDFAGLAPIGDVRAEAAYRSASVPVLVRRAITRALEA
ncbi:FAD binding domain-containing protein [Pararhodobacter oceanensis]|uniref:Xanthine dehydrogenase n=1 Tax=Pararhodobacter oceanensis TaxID=2172121 RepID=A0A2T8HRK2_9RHOB|nr:FAD binding domain-containing protein [Pararhodobacter oceanensis]PVH28079.1 xanthine dehydrogenase [Pararhodobacter oceanensis]